MFENIPTITTYTTEVDSLRFISTFTVHEDSYKASTVVMHGRDVHELGRYSTGNFKISILDQLKDHNTFVFSKFKTILKEE